MPLEVTSLTRKFTFKKNGSNIDLPDPNISLTATEVLKFYSGTYPELTNAMIDGPAIENDIANYTISTKAGQLG
jgi:PRTRC genetic system protein C